MARGEGEFGRKIAEWSYRTLKWGQERVPFGVRSVVGLLLMVGGVLGFLPVLGFWMLPLGLAFIALDVPPLQHRIEAWMVRLHRRAYGERPDSDQDA